MGYPLYEEIKELKYSFDQNLNSYNQNFFDLDRKIDEVNNNINNLNKNRSIEWALNELDKENPIGCFEYYSENDTPIKSTELIRNTLLAFRKGGANYIFLNKEKQDELTKEFREKFSEQIELLLGKKPQIHLNDDGSFTAYY